MAVRRLLSLAVLTVAAMCASNGASAQTADPSSRQVLTIGYVELDNDARYDADRAHERIPLHPGGRPFVAAAMALEEAAPLAQALHLDFTIQHATGIDVSQLVDKIAAWHRAGIDLVVADLPAAALEEVTGRATAETILFNVSAPDDFLRGAGCRANLLHTIPSTAMRTDALVQFLVARKWRNMLVLRGPTDQDTAAAAALGRAATRFGARIVESKPFALTNDPRQREQGRVPLMTAGADYDVVYVIDSVGDFARTVPYAVNRPRPVVGAAGLFATGWHWAWDQHGAIQLNRRFEKAGGRPMGESDWAAWAAVRAIIQAVQRSHSTKSDALMAYMTGEAMTLDGYKGNPMSFRPWDHQLRQPMLLATDTNVVERAPLPGFLHEVNVLDTLEADRPDSECRIGRAAPH